MIRVPSRLALALALLAPVPASILAAMQAGAAGIAAAVASMALAGIAVGLLRRPAPPPAAPPPAALREPAVPPALPEIDAKLKQLRHDLRGALAPALLTTDRLLSHPDAAMQRCGSVVTQSIQRAIALVEDIRAAPLPEAKARPARR